jgi:uncharacterized protein (TIRG00374 family)
MLSILIINVVPDVLLLYSKSKKSWFWRLMVDNIKCNFYNHMTICSSGGYSVVSTSLKKRGIDDKVAVDISRSKKITRLIALVLYSFLVATIGSVIYFKDINIFWLVATIICFLILCIRLLFILLIDRHRDSGIGMVSRVCKLLYKIGIVKDLDVFYKRIIHEIVVANRSLRSNGKILTTQIICSMVGLFLKHFILYVILLMLNFDVSGVFFEMLTFITIFDIVVSVWPLPAGTLIFELLFILRFNSIFGGGYVIWALIMYRVVTYYLPIICRYCIMFFENICLKKGLQEN